ncbi:formyltransferase family protein [Agrobacterium sp. lyk4-40-TYG-31]|uniref:formyltransferase family protein n=1 Tax=Agrobacterium sp. lyk4-40-TYG-31 TaxID=3040276 RepID=UPI00254B2D3E|nr:formyltransferase family protein [Agrobacterium sp. lyk4-40-TYG-31]
MSVNSRSVVACADGVVGKILIEWISINFPNALSLVVTISENEIFQYCKAKEINVEALAGRPLGSSIQEKLRTQIDIGLLLWWPSIITASDINVAKEGFINTHPSLLPFHRGKNPNFWALKAGEPFGVSLHFLGQGIDDGDVVAQKEILYDWTDNAETLYRKSQEEIVNLFQKIFPFITEGSVTRHHQNLEEGNFHYAKEMVEASHLDLDNIQSIRDTLNILRARTFSGYPSCWFHDEKGNEYEVRVSINRRPHR